MLKLPLSIKTNQCLLQNSLLLLQPFLNYDIVAALYTVGLVKSISWMLTVLMVILALCQVAHIKSMRM
jgi:hypothetical protein